MSKIFVADKLKIRGNKTLSTIALILILTFSALMAATPSANAHTPAWTLPTWAYISVMPNPVGVGQTAYLGFWIDKVPPTAYQQYGDRWQGFTVTVTKPDGTTATLGPFTSDDVGGSHTTFTPTTTGSYTFVFNFPGQTIAGANPSPLVGIYQPTFVGDYYQPSTSPKVSLTVQQQQVPYNYPAAPLPTGYWQRPIEALNLDWYTLGGNWLGLAPNSFIATGMYNATENFNPYTTAPDSAHIVWTKPYSFGGMIGGEFGGTEDVSHYTSTFQYETKWAGIIINGVLYYNLNPGSTANTAGWVAADLRTGQTIWTKNTTSFLRCGQILDVVTPNQYGGYAYLWALPLSPYASTGGSSPQFNNTWEMYDAMTGNWILNIVNAPATPTVISANLTVTIAQIPTLVEDNSGNLLGYYVNGTTHTLNMWNSTLAIMQYSYLSGRSVNSWCWTPSQGASIDWSLGIQWSVPLVRTITAANGTSVPLSPDLAISKIASDVLLMTSTPEVSGYSWNPGYVYEAGYSAIDGHLLWGPLIRTETPWTRLSLVATALNGVYYEFTLETMSWRAFSLTTGTQLWGPTALFANDTYGYYSQSSMVAYGALYMSDLGGYVYALDAKTGAPLWTFFTGSSGLESPYGEYPLLHIDVAADGKLYVQGGHTYSPPLFLGSNLWCLNATTGAVIWKISNFCINNGPNCALADGYLIEPNAYDNQLYAYGTGRSATTVSIHNNVISKGSAVLIQGTVTDQSPGQTCLGIPAAGTPAISDASMSQWMQYLYMQQPEPTNATGVPVTLTAIDPNGNTQNIGTVTSNTLGNYAIAWTPPVPGLYTVVANFAGSNSYYGSVATTNFVVTAAAAAAPASPQASATAPPTATPIQTAAPSPQVTGTPAPAPSSPGVPTTYIIIAVVAIIIVVAAAALALRRRK